MGPNQRRTLLLIQTVTEVYNREEVYSYKVVGSSDRSVRTSNREVARGVSLSVLRSIKGHLTESV
jgi:hypothetical protein